MTKKIFENIAWLSGDQFIRLAIGFFVGAWVARYLQPEQFGQLNYSLALVSLFMPIANLNDLDKVAVRDITQEPGSESQIVGTVFFLKLATSLAAFSLLFVVALIFSGDQQSFLISSIIGITILCCPISAIDCWFTYKVEAKYTVVARNIVFIASSIGKIILIYLKAPLITFALLISVEAILRIVSLVIAYKVSGQFLKNWHFNYRRAKQLLKDSWSLILAGFAISIYLSIDQTMLGQMVGQQQVGVYAVAVRLSSICVFLPAAIVNSTSPKIIDSRKKDENEFYRKLQILFDTLSLLSFGLIISAILFSHFLITIVYGEAYIESSNILIVHIFSIFSVSMGIAKSIWVIAENEGNYSLIISYFGVFLNIGLNLILIPKYQALGAAIATLISYTFIDYFTCFMYYPARKIGNMITKSIFFNSHIKKAFGIRF